MIFINFKTYIQGTGENALKLAKIIEEVSQATGVKIVAIVQATDVREVAQSVTIEVWSQKVDSADYGAHTGAILPEAVQEDGAQGTLVNHSEDKVENQQDIAKIVDKSNQLGLKTLVFASDLSELKAVASYHPTFVSYEPPEFIGNNDMSVAKSQPEIISQAASIAKEIGVPLIVGAGISTTEDVRKSLELGAVGVVLSSSVVKSDNPKQKLLELVEGFK